MAKPDFIKPYSGSRRRISTEIVGESMAEQSHKKECDINFIIKNYERTGVVTHLSSMQAQFADVESTDLLSALNVVEQATESFGALPSALREQFDNDPVLFLDALNNPTPQDIETLQQYGLIDSPPLSNETVAEPPASNDEKEPQIPPKKPAEKTPQD